MHHQFNKVDYKRLNSRQKENYNFQMLSAVLAYYGFVTMRLSDDWHGADFIAQHVDGETFLRVQLKSRLTINKKYSGKGLYIAFPANGSWYIGPHDELRDHVLEATTIESTDSWMRKGGYSVGKLSANLLKIVKPYRLPWNSEVATRGSD